MGFFGLLKLQTLKIFCRKTTMALIQKFLNYLKKNVNFYLIFKDLGQKTVGFNFKIVASIILIVTLIFFGSMNYLSQKNALKKK